MSKHPDFSFLIRSDAATTLGMYTNFISVTFIDNYNDIGFCQIEVEEGHPILDDLSLDYVIEAHSTLEPTTFGELQFIGLYRGFDISISEDKKTKTYTLNFSGLFSILQRSIVAFRADNNTASKFTATALETILYNVIDKNIDDVFVGIGRVTAVTDLGILIFTSGDVDATGITMDYDCAFRNVYDVVKELLAVTDLKTVFEDAGSSYRLEFNDFGTSQGGTDRTGDYILSDIFSNVYNVSIESADTSKPTKAIVGGSGKGASRLVETVTSSDNSTNNNFEVFVNSSNSEDTTQMEKAGEAFFNSNKNVKIVTCDLIVSDEIQPFVNMLPGDHINTYFNGTLETKLIKSISVSLAEKFAVYSLELQDT